VTTESDLYWQTRTEDAAMQDEHGFVWRAMLDTIDADHGNSRLMSAGVRMPGVAGRIRASQGP
jgi:GTP-dependent phosphoenolpyruvate carboxykinase